MVSEDCKIENDQVNDQPFDQQNDQRKRVFGKRKKKISPTPPIKEKIKYIKEKEEKAAFFIFFGFNHRFFDVLVE